MIGLEILVRIDPDKRVEFLQAFEMVRQIKQMDDNHLEFQLFEDVQKQNTFLWLEHSDSAESLNQYCLGNKFKAMMGAIDTLGQLIHKRLFVIKEEEEEEEDNG